MSWLDLTFKASEFATLAGLTMAIIKLAPKFLNALVENTRVLEQIKGFLIGQGMNPNTRERERVK